MTKHLKNTPPFRTINHKILPGSIAEAKYMVLGGIDQYVLIRGESIDNPLLIILHGGPGLSDTPFLRRFNSSLEKSFTIVYWDQRGVGHSYYPGIPKSSMTIEQFITDLNELVDLICERFGKNKISILGHSWGSALGILYSVRFPQKVAAYIGCGQYGDWSAAESSSYAYVVNKASSLNNRKALKELNAIGPPPFSAGSLLKERTWLQRFEGQLRPSALWKMARIFLSGPESSVFDLARILKGFKFSFNAMWDEVSMINLLKDAPSLEMPVFFLLGKNDHWVPPETSKTYFDILKAPSKKLVWFEESGHEPFADEPERFNKTLVEFVHPVVAN